MLKIYSKFFCNKTKIEKEFLKLDYYSILKVNSNSSTNEIRKSYFQLAKKFHPDKYKGTSEIFKKITEAYKILKDEKKREEYNKKMRINMNIKYKYSSNKKDNEEEQQNSKYEKDFEKLNINQKSKPNIDEIKIIKGAVEKKLSKRQYQLHLLTIKVREAEMKRKSLKYEIYKNMGLITDEENKSNDSYDKLVKDELKNIKNKITYKEEINENIQKEKKEDEVSINSTRNTLYYIFTIYFLIAILILIRKYQQHKNLEKQIKLNEKLKNEKRINNYIYIK